ncbi:hypothetical protein [Listeria seeligeri]|uniref:hypothetical protein n=1 Tax=Listeria seeligeri TaxID=1640 RepID=UPI001627D0B0|nr:hypothetical protein [Listeria seeligeri]MBC1737067.1 hypothetical protein [Listeria seeligeri]MBF2454362.1 hypothetical protein [Listeria seeligeri]MBF2670075.1 hypothetical protein [Listeria seeligeri]
MSYTKKIYEDQIESNISRINSITLEKNDISELLDYLEIFIEIQKKFEEEDFKENDLNLLLNDVLVDIIACIHLINSGFYRQSMVSLRGVMELGCRVLYYYDHRIEYRFLISENVEATKYVSRLVNDENFFKTKYIKYFYEEIENIENSKDSISTKLSYFYSKLSDEVHGRFKTLRNANSLAIDYSKSYFMSSKSTFCEILNLLAVMYYLRFFNKGKIEISEIYKKMMCRNEVISCGVFR